MLTVPKPPAVCAAIPRLSGVGSGRADSPRAGSQHLSEESDLLTLVPPAETRLPAVWRRTVTGEPMPDVVRAVRRSRDGR